MTMCSLSLSDEERKSPVRAVEGETRRFDIRLPTPYQRPPRPQRSSARALDEERKEDYFDDENGVSLAPELKELIRQQHRSFGPLLRQPQALVLWSPKMSDVWESPIVELASSPSCTLPTGHSVKLQRTPRRPNSTIARPCRRAS